MKPSPARKLLQQMKTGNSNVKSCRSPLNDRKWPQKTTMMPGISPSGKVGKKTPGKCKLKGQFNFGKIKQHFELLAQLQVRTPPTNTNPIAAQVTEDEFCSLPMGSQETKRMELQKCANQPGKEPGNEMN